MADAKAVGAGRQCAEVEVRLERRHVISYDGLAVGRRARLSVGIKYSQPVRTGFRTDRQQNRRAHFVLGAGSQ